MCMSMDVDICVDLRTMLVAQRTQMLMPTSMTTAVRYAQAHAYALAQTPMRMCARPHACVCALLHEWTDGRADGLTQAGIDG